IREGRELVGTAGVEMESLLAGLQTDRKTAADERYHLSMERAEAEYQRRELERQRVALEEQRHTILSEARRQARREVEEVQAELARIRSEIARKRAAPERLSALRSQAHLLEERVAPLPPPVPQAAEEPEESDVPEAGPLKVGDAVRVRAMNQRG